jgi:hypothetical protein
MGFVGNRLVGKVVGFGLLALIGFLSFQSCSTKVDVAAPWKEIGVLYCLLDPDTPQQVVRLEKAFLGEGNALIYAQEYDSLYFDTAKTEVKLFVKANNTWQSLGTLKPEYRVNKEGGAFANPLSLVYVYPLTIAEGVYRIEARLPSGAIISSETQTVAQPRFRRPVPLTTNFSRPWVNGRPNEVSISFTTPLNANLYDATVLIQYREFRSGVTETKLLPWIQYRARQIEPSGERIELRFDGAAMFRYMRANIAVDPSVQRTLDTVYYDMRAGGEALTEYVRINGPSESLNDVRPIYSNIDGGYGLFSARRGDRVFTTPTPTIGLDSLRLIFPELNFN